MRMGRSRSALVIGAAVLTVMGLAGSVAGVAPAGAAATTKSPGTTVTGLTATPSLVHVEGGFVTLTATVARAVSCTFSSNRPVTGLPATVVCSTGVVTDTVHLPVGNPKRTIGYKLTLTVTGTKRVHSKVTVDVLTTSCSDRGPGVDLRDCDLADQDLTGANLSDADLAGADLSGADLSGADLAGADLSTTDLDGADLTGTILTGVTWSATTCPDGTNSDSDGDTCAADESLSVPPSGLAPAMIDAEAAGVENNESFTGMTLAELDANEPTVQFTSGPSTGPDQISTYFSSDGNGIVLAATQGDGICWYLGLQFRFRRPRSVGHAVQLSRRCARLARRVVREEPGIIVQCAEPGAGRLAGEHLSLLTTPGSRRSENRTPRLRYAPRRAVSSSGRAGDF